MSSNIFVSIFSIVTVFILLTPVLRYFAFGWASRKREIINRFDSDSINTYFSKFQPKEDKGDDSIAAFDGNYEKRFGRVHFVIPFIGLIVVSLCVMYLSAHSILALMKIQVDSEIIFPDVALAAISGAYMWTTYNLISRNRSFDISPADISLAAFRLIISVPAGYAVAALFNEGISLAVAFMIGAFPTKTMFTIFRRVASRKLDVGDSSYEEHPELEKLQSINAACAEKYADQGVDTIVKLAYCDPVYITIKTGFSFNYVVDCVSQALAWLYFEDKLQSLRLHSLRGAQEISNFESRLESIDSDERDCANKALSQISMKLDVDIDSLKQTFKEISGDPYTIFLCEVWR